MSSILYPLEDIVALIVWNSSAWVSLPRLKEMNYIAASKSFILISAWKAFGLVQIRLHVCTYIFIWSYYIIINYIYNYIYIHRYGWYGVEYTNMYNCIIINYKQYTIFSDGSGLDSLFCKQLQDSSWTRMGRRLKVFLCIGYIHFGRSSGTLKLFVLVSIPKLRMWPLRPLQWNTMAHETSHIILPVIYHYCRFCSCCHPFASPVNRLANMKAHLVQPERQRKDIYRNGGRTQC